MPTYKAVTLKTVAERASVSPSVVSTVLSGRENGIFVSEATRQKVLAAAAELGYQRRPRRTVFPRPRPSVKTGLVGVLLGRRFGGTLFTDTFYGINSALSPWGYHPVVLDTYAEHYAEAAEKEAAGIRYAREHGFSAIILWHEGGPANVPLIREAAARMPVVAIDRRVPDIPLDFAGTDHVQGAAEATRALLDLGHRRIAHVTRLDSTQAALERLQGYRQALSDAGVALDPRWILPTLEPGRSLAPARLRAALALPDRPTALFLLSDYWAPPVIAEVARIGLSIPNDLSLVGFDDVVQPGLDGDLLTTMAQDFEGIGRAAGEFVLRRLEHPDAAPVSRLFPARLVVRKTTAPPP